MTTPNKRAGDPGELVPPASADEAADIEDLDELAGHLVEEARAKASR